MLNLGDTFPNFQAPSTCGKIDLYEHFGESWGILFSHPRDFTPVCTTELGRMAQLQKEFAKRAVKVACLSVDSVSDHEAWLGDVVTYSGCQWPFPMIADVDGSIARDIGMLDKSAQDTLTVRGVFILDPSKVVKAIILYPASTGRNFDEILRLLDSLQYTAKNSGVVTPADWKVGDKVLVKPGCEAPEGCEAVKLPSGRDYLTYTKHVE